MDCPEILIDSKYGFRQDAAQLDQEDRPVVAVNEQGEPVYGDADDPVPYAIFVTETGGNQWANDTLTHSHSVGTTAGAMGAPDKESDHGL